MVLENYEKIIIAFSGGKDSTACLLHLLELGVDRSKIELWHHDVDGQGVNFMDWPITTGYCRAFAEAFNIPLYLSWKLGGFFTEMMRVQSETAPIYTESPTGLISNKERLSNRPKKLGTRMKFPQVSADLKVRWCSAYLKIDVMSSAIRMQDRFKGSKVLVVTGERGEESPARAKYKEMERHRSDNRDGRTPVRTVDHWRPIRDWSEREVWAIIERWNVTVHPCYYLGFSRCSCMKCIFGNADQFASAHALDPDGTKQLGELEKSFGTTIKRKESVPDLVSRGKPYAAIENNQLLAEIAMRDEFPLPIITDNWTLPAGAYGESCGPS